MRRYSSLALLFIAILLSCSLKNPVDNSGSTLQTPISINTISGVVEEDRLVGFKVTGEGLTSDIRATIDSYLLTLALASDTELIATIGLQISEGMHVFTLKKGSLAVADTVKIYRGQNGKSIVWKGTFVSAPLTPDTLWAYYNSADNAAYIWDGTRWTTLVLGVAGPIGIGITWKGSLDAAPVNPDTNWAYYDTARNCSFVWTGTVWDTLAAGATGPTGENGIDGLSIIWKGSLVVAPTDPKQNWAYLNTASNIAFIYTGTVWDTLIVGIKGDDGVSISWKGTLTSNPLLPSVNWAYYNTDDNVSYIYNGTAWDTLCTGITGDTGATGADGINGKSIVWKGSSIAPPAAPDTNWSYYNPGTNVSYIWDGDSWEILALGANLPGMTITLPALTNDATPTATWSSYPNALGYRFRFVNDTGWTLSDTNVHSYTPVLSLPDGQNMFVLQARIGTTTYTSSFPEWTTVDCTPPSMPAVTSPLATNDLRPTWSWNVPATTAGFRFQLDGQAGIWIEADAATVAFTPAVDLTTASHTVYVQAKDVAGNWSPSGSGTTVVDTTPPAAMGVTVPDSSGDLRPTWTWTLPATTTGFRYQLDGTSGSWTAVASSVLSYRPSSSLSEGVHILFVQARDAASNWSVSGFDSCRLQLIPMVTSPGSTTDSTPTWTWTTPTGCMGFKYKLDAGAWTEVSASQTSFTPSSSLARGIYTLYVQSKIAAGTWSMSGSSSTWVDTGWFFGTTGSVDPADKILAARFLSTNAEANFSISDGRVSPFWSNWTGDYISMNSSDPLYARSRSATSPFAGGEDAAMVVRAAYSSAGVYFYFEVTDNGWVDPSIWANDVVEIYTDALSSAGIVDQLNWFNPIQWALTFTSKTLQLPMGSTAPVTNWNYRYYSELDVNMMDYPSVLNDPNLGILMEIITIDATHKTQEWFIPWAQWGVNGAVSNGMKFGFIANYNDMDPADGAEVNSLSWIQLCDPYCLPDASLWGDIELVGSAQ